MLASLSYHYFNNHLHNKIDLEALTIDNEQLHTPLLLSYAWRGRFPITHLSTTLLNPHNLPDP